MRMRYLSIIISNCCLLMICLLSGCSVTKNLPEGEVLYTGQKTVVLNESKTRMGETVMTEVEAALDKAPSTTMLGGFLPIPFKMWMYNDFVKYKKGLGKWMFNKFAANPPVFISTVSPEIRVKAATNLLHDYGFFNGNVTYEVLPDKKDSLKADIRYTVDMKNPYFIDTVYYERFNAQTLKIMEKGRRMSYLTPGEQFNVVDLDDERTRISGLLRNLGYFYFLEGKVVNGYHVGRKIGFPTANLSVNSPDKLIPQNGVYAVLVTIDEKEYMGMLNIGVRPTVNNGVNRTIEVHILHFDADIYGKSIRLTFVERIRPELRFSSLQALTDELQKDAETVERILTSRTEK